MFIKSTKITDKNCFTRTQILCFYNGKYTFGLLFNNRRDTFFNYFQDKLKNIQEGWQFEIEVKQRVC